MKTSSSYSTPLRSTLLACAIALGTASSAFAQAYLGLQAYRRKKV